MLNSLLADPWLLASAIAQLFLLVLGLVVTLQEEWAKKHKWILIGAFVVFGGIAFVATMIQGRSSAKAATDLAVSLQKLSAASIETQRQTALNTKLQGQLVSQSNTITDLANRNIASVTGGDSFCYADFMGTADQVQQEVLVIFEGKYPLYDVYIRMTDLSEPDMSKANILGYEIGNFGVLGARVSRTIGTVRFTHPGPKQDFNIFFNGRNGIWTELHRMRKVNGGWEKAILVEASFATKRFPQGHRMFQEVSKNYPVEELRKDKDWQNALKMPLVKPK